MKKLGLFSVFFATFLFLQFNADAHVRRPHKYFDGYNGQTSFIVLPDVLKKEIYKKYGHFRIARKRNYCSNFKQKMQSAIQNNIWSYGVLRNDFNGDGDQDYSLIIKTKDNRYVWLLALGTYYLEQRYLITDLGWPSIDHFNHTSHVFSGKNCEGLLVMGPPLSLPEKNKYNYIALSAPNKSVRVYYRPEDNKFYETGFNNTYEEKRLKVYTPQNYHHQSDYVIKQSKNYRD